CKVGSYRPNRLGLHDMEGNLLEWCADAAKQWDRTRGRVVRGGAYWLTVGQLNSGNVLPPQGVFHDVGLRVARVPVARANARREDFDAWQKEVAALPAEQQVAAVVALLRVRNPTFYDTKVKSRIADGVVTELSLRTDDVTDLEPVRALT